MLIGLMFLKNQVVYVQFHPVAYMVKLNIEMSMAALITRLAKERDTSLPMDSLSYSGGPKGSVPTYDGLKNQGQRRARTTEVDVEWNATPPSAGIHKRFDIEVRTEPIKDGEQSGDDMASGNGYYKVDDERS